MRAAERGQLSVVRALLKKGAEVDAKHPWGFTALMVASREGHLPVVKLLLAAGANPNVTVRTSHAGEINVLIWGITSRNQLVVQALIKGGAQVNPKLEEGLTPLMMGVGFGSLGIVNTMIAGGADVNARIFNGYTALMVAADQWDPAITKVLIVAGADVNARNKFGETALALARREKNDAVIAVLKRAGAREVVRAQWKIYDKVAVSDNDLVNLCTQIHLRKQSKLCIAKSRQCFSSAHW